LENLRASGSANVVAKMIRKRLMEFRMEQIVPETVIKRKGIHRGYGGYCAFEDEDRQLHKDREKLEFN
jgi:hypothetical protein